MARRISLVARLFCWPWLERARLAVLAGCARLVRPGMLQCQAGAVLT